MNRPQNHPIPHRFRPHWIALGLAGAMLALAGCPAGNTGGNDNQTANDNAKPGNPTSKIVNIGSNFPLSEIAPPVAIEYVVADDRATVEGVEVSGFYRQMADDSPGADQIGAGDVIIATGLPAAGDNLFFSFDPSLTGIGFFRVGIVVLVSGEEVERLLSTGTIHVQGPPDPVFRLPVEDVSDVTKGATVRILFDAQDPEGDVRWRLFYLNETERITKESTSADQLGTEISTGASNVGEAFLATNRLDVGTYEIGVSAVDSGDSITRAVIEGRQDQIITVFGKIINVVSPPPNPAAPTLVFTSPSASGEILLRPEFFDIQFQATVDPSVTGTATVELFWDENALVSDGVTTIVDGLPITDTSFNYRVAERCEEGVEEVTFHIGGNVVNVTPPLTQYAAGTVTIICEVNLDIVEPNTSLPFEPGAPVNIEWTTNAPVDSGTLDVFARQIIDGVRGPEIPIRSGEPLTTTTASFTSNAPGIFDIFVRLNLQGGEIIEQVAPQPVQFSSLPGVLWLGSLAQANPTFSGAIFQGVNFEDNAGTSFASAGDLDGDGTDDFVVAARYGKPFFVNPTGVGPGEAYLIYGRSGTDRVRGVFNLNSVGTTGLRGVTFSGIRTPQTSNDTDGLSDVKSVPDLDGDGRRELLFGFPNTDSRGHNIDPQQDGVIIPQALSTLEREKQFKNGGLVFVSSVNSILRDPTNGTPVINLDMVGQDFLVPCVGPEPDGFAVDGFGEDDFYEDIFNPQSMDPPCQGSCTSPQAGGLVDANNTLNHGFVKALARDYFYTYVFSFDWLGGVNSCAGAGPFLGSSLECGVEYCTPFPAACEPFSPGLHSAVFPFEIEVVEDPFSEGTLQFVITDRRSGFYVTWLEGPDGTLVRNAPLEPFGARVIGVASGDAFGTSLTLSRSASSGPGSIIVSAPARDARGILLGPTPEGCDNPPDCGGEIDGLESATGVPKVNPDSGVAYLFPLRSLWTDEVTNFVIPPKPHQYIVGEASHCGGPVGLIDNIDAIRIAGLSSDNIRNIVGIDDFNGDGRDDFAVGTPTSGAGTGSVYVAFRREPALEGDYVLEKLSLDPGDPDRLDGVLITAQSLNGLGASLATGVDFNGDGLRDLVIGSPNASAGIGEIIVVFGDPNLISPRDGITVQDLLTSRNSQGQPRAARITGNALDVNGQFGFNVAMPGDVDGDGINDLIVAAPNASPRFDPNPNDSIDELIESGVDVNPRDGIQDDVSGQFLVPDGVIDSADDLSNAGIVYVISGANRLDQFVPQPEISLSIDQLGSDILRGYMVIGRQAGDRLGGGDAGDQNAGGLDQKLNRGRSFGLAGAGDVNNDGMDDFLIGAVLADPRIDPNTGEGTRNAGEAYLVYGAPIP
jgi:hypothetical protein